jgi:hypothetical protein
MTDKPPIPDPPSFDRPLPRQAEVWRHFKGGYYEILCVGWHTELHTYEVSYRAWPPEQGEVTFVNHLTRFMSRMDDGRPRYERREIPKGRGIWDK